MKDWRDLLKAHIDGTAPFEPMTEDEQRIARENLRVKLEQIEQANEDALPEFIAEMKKIMAGPTKH